MMLRILSFLICVLFSYSSFGSPEAEPFANFKAIEFNKDKVGIIFNNGVQNNGPELNNLVYGLLENKNFKKLSDTEFKTQFHSVKSLTKFEDKDLEQEYKIKYKDCVANPEVEATCKSVDITVEKKVININFKKMKICDSCSIFQVEKWNNHLWISFSFQSEYWLDSEGVFVIDITKKNKIKPINPKILATVFSKDPTTKTMWIGGPEGIEVYDENLKLLHKCELKHDAKVHRPESSTPYFDFSFNCTK